MKRKKVTKLIISIIIIIIAIINTISTSGTKHTTLTGLNEDYIIENVPYVGQYNRYTCAFASFTMIFQYYDCNITLEDLLHHAGIAYSIAQTNFKIPGIIENPVTPTSSAGLAQNPSNIEYVASLYGLKPTDSSNFIQSLFEQKNWEMYWSQLKNFIKEDIPIITSVDPYSLPFYVENDLLPKYYDHAGHAVIVIGFNESNNTVCINDPGTCLFNDSNSGTYCYLSKNVFKSAVENTTGSKFIIKCFEKDDDKTAFTDEEIFDICHRKNIERMQGKIGSYIGSSSNITFSVLGINSLKKYKKNLQNPILRFYTFTKLKRINRNILNNSFNLIGRIKQNMSEYLTKKENISNFCKYDAFLLQQEAECCKKLHQFNLELYEIGKNNNILKAMFLSNNLVKKMIEEIDRMITFEQAIINGPAE